MWKASDRAKSGRSPNAAEKPRADTTWLEDFLASRPLLRKVVGRIVKPEEIEDIVQETFVLTFAASRKKKIDNPGGFMLATARNIALNMLKRADMKGHVSLDEIPDEDDLLASDAVSVEDQCQSDEMFLCFCRAVARLPVDCRRVFILKKVYGLNQVEIADMLEISPSTVEKHVARGMATTGRYMVARGYWDEPLSASVSERRSKGVYKP